MTTKTKFRILQDDTPEVTRIPDSLFLSANGKTGLSINVAIAKTCRPTKACSEYCYGLESRIRMGAALRRQVENWKRFEFLAKTRERVLEDEATLIAETVLAKQTFLRFFGVGDLQPGSVRFINILANNAPTLALWVSSRRLELAAQLVERPNLHAMLSLDATTPAKFVTATQALIEKRPTFFAAWAQTKAREPIPKWVSVVFAEHHALTGRAVWSGRKRIDRRTCPATVLDGAPHENACAACHYCFSVEKRDLGGPLVTLQKRK